MILEPLVEAILEKQERKVNIEQKALVFALLRTRAGNLVFRKA